MACFLGLRQADAGHVLEKYSPTLRFTPSGYLRGASLWKNQIHMVDFCDFQNKRDSIFPGGRLFIRR